MIQRIQTLFFLIVIALHVTLFFVPVWEGAPATEGGQRIVMDVSSVSHNDPGGGEGGMIHENLTLWTSILNFSIIALTGICIFMFKRRLQQLRLSRLALVLECALIGLFFWIISEIQGDTSYEVESSYQLGVFFPIIGLILLFLAGRRILADERLVRSADRLR